MKIGIILGSIRENRSGQAIAEWVSSIAQDRATGVDYELIDLKAFDLPLLSSPALPMMANKKYDDPSVQTWSDTIDSCDAFVFVTPEYNRSVPGPFKNAYDSLGSEWQGKPVAYIGYGYSGGVRAVEAWRLVASNFSMKQLRTQVEISLVSDYTEGTFTPADFKVGLVDNLLAELEDTL